MDEHNFPLAVNLNSIVAIAVAYSSINVVLAQKKETKNVSFLFFVTNFGQMLAVSPLIHRQSSTSPE